MEFTISNLTGIIPLRAEQIEKMTVFLADTMKLEAESCSIVLLNDEELRSMHEAYLSDPEFTDVMTFNLGDDKIEGEIYISLDRIKDNADFYGVPLVDEFLRTVIHGLLHLSGLNDKTTDERAVMQDEENNYLKRLKSEFKLGE